MRTRLVGLIVLALTSTLVVPVAAEAQRRSHHVGGAVVIVGGYTSPGFWFARPAWWQPYPYPYPPYGRYPYGYGLGGHTVALRLDVDQKDAEVYVDGYYAGVVDDFDGVFQRLRITPGEHEITIFLDGYRALQERRYFNPNASMRLRLRMEPLAPGEPQDAKPVPAAPPATGRGRPEPPRAGVEPSRPERPQRPARFGTIALRIQPADAEILIDGERWQAQPGDARIAIELAPGRHKIEVRKEGYKPYVEEVLIRPDATLTLNVSLSRVP